MYDTAGRRVVASAAVNYGKDLPEFGSPDGFLPNADANVRRANPAMWVKGLELVLSRLRDAGAPMGEIAAVGGDAQQHATVYLDADGNYSRAESPIWMDASTGAEVAELDARFGGALRTRTGSPAIERFAAAQVMKFAREEPEAYSRTARVHLLSSYLTSVLAGADAPIETGDGAGMNLLNLQTLSWDADICAFAAPGLLAKLPAVHRPGDAPLRLAERFAEFGLRPGIPVAPFTGDNPASLVGCGAAEPGCAVISLGTSDTFFAAMRDFRTDPDGCGPASRTGRSRATTCGATAGRTGRSSTRRRSRSRRPATAAAARSRTSRRRSRRSMTRPGSRRTSTGRRLRPR